MSDGDFTAKSDVSSGNGRPKRQLKDGQSSSEPKRFTHEKEVDPHRLKNRQKQIDFGKNTVGYDNYTKKVVRNLRKRDDPWTPEKSQKCSKRSWDGQIRIWRRRLHLFDPVYGGIYFFNFQSENDENADSEKSGGIVKSQFDDTFNPFVGNKLIAKYSVVDE